MGKSLSDVVLQSVKEVCLEEDILDYSEIESELLLSDIMNVMEPFLQDRFGKKYRNEYTAKQFTEEVMEMKITRTYLATLPREFNEQKRSGEGKGSYVLEGSKWFLMLWAKLERILLQQGNFKIPGWKSYLDEMGLGLEQLSFGATICKMMGWKYKDPGRTVLVDGQYKGGEQISRGGIRRYCWYIPSDSFLKEAFDSERQLTLEDVRNSLESYLKEKTIQVQYKWRAYTTAYRLGVPFEKLPDKTAAMQKLHLIVNHTNEDGSFDKEAKKTLIDFIVSSIGFKPEMWEEEKEETIRKEFKAIYNVIPTGLTLVYGKHPLEHIGSLIQMVGKSDFIKVTRKVAKDPSIAPTVSQYVL